MTASRYVAAISASSICFQAAVLVVLVGMGWGIVMAISHDHSTMPAHAHLNLLGWVSLFLFGVFYHLHPGLDRSRFAVAQVALWIIGTVVMVAGVALIHTGREVGEPLAGIGSILALAAMVMFAWAVLRRNRVPAVLPVRSAPVPAE